MKTSSKKKTTLKLLKPDVIFRPAPKIAPSAITKSIAPVKIKIGKAQKKSISAATAGIDFNIEEAVLPGRLEAAVKNIRMMLKNVTVKDNKAIIGRSQVYIFTAVIDNVSAEPSLTLNTYDGIANGDDLSLGPSGLAIYRNPKDKSPSSLDYRIVVMVSKQEIRDTGAILGEIQSNKEYQSLRDKASLAVTASNPSAALVIPAADLALGLIGKILKADKDHQIIYVVGSFDRAFDQLGIKYGLIPHETRGAKIAYQVEEAQ